MANLNPEVAADIKMRDDRKSIMNAALPGSDAYPPSVEPKLPDEDTKNRIQDPISAGGPKTPKYEVVTTLCSIIHKMCL